MCLFVPHSMVKIQPFSQVFLSAGPMPEAFYWSFLWNFKKTSASPYDRDFSKNEKREPTFVDSLGVILFEVLVGMKGFEPSTP